jgi:uncharacterized protein (TIGR03435 family)
MYTLRMPIPKAVYAGVIIGVLAQGQTPAEPRFEVASVKLHREGAPFGPLGPAPGGRFNASGVPVMVLVIYAFDKKLDQISGAPEFMFTEGYDIAAKAASEATLTPAQVRPMLQALLADRFHLKVHYESKPLPVYALIVGKNGPKLKRSAPDAHASASTRVGPVIQAVFSKASMALLATGLSAFADRPVLDQTGLTGNYDIKLEWSGDDSQAAQDSGAASLFTAVHEQLGLKLEPRRAPVEVVVIDHAERPSEN